MATNDTEVVPIDFVKRYRGNPRVHDLDTIRESVRLHGQYKPLVVRRRTKEILAGNGTHEAMELEGFTEVSVIWHDCDAKEARKIVAIDNRAHDLGGYDNEALLALLGQIPDLEGTGYTSEDRERMANQLWSQAGGDTDAPPVPAKPKSRRGDLYLLGDSRLLCGDATNQLDVTKVLNGEHPVMMWTDPPYIGPDDNSTQHINAVGASNSVDSLHQLLHESFGLANEHLAKGASIYVAHPGGPNSAVFYEAFVAQPWRIRQTLVWLKEGPGLRFHDYTTEHELLLDGEKSRPELISYGFVRDGKERFYGPRNATSVLRFDRARIGGLHPTAKPVGLVERLVLNSSRPGELVYDPFLGSGTTLIACANTGRRFAGLEIDPGYVDVIVARWEKHTGESATRTRV